MSCSTQLSGFLFIPLEWSSKVPAPNTFPGGRAGGALYEQVVDGVDAAAERVLDRQHGAVGEVLRQGLEGVLKLLAGYRVGVGEGRQHCTLAVRPRHALVCHRERADMGHVLHQHPTCLIACSKHSEYVLKASKFKFQSGSTINLSK